MSFKTTSARSINQSNHIYLNRPALMVGIEPPKVIAGSCQRLSTSPQLGEKDKGWGDRRHAESLGGLQPADGPPKRVHGPPSTVDPGSGCSGATRQVL